MVCVSIWIFDLIMMFKLLSGGLYMLGFYEKFKWIIYL